MNLQDPSSEQWQAWVKELEAQAQSTFWGVLGGKLLQLTPGCAVAVLTIIPKHLNHLGIVHGGVHAAMLDSVMGLAAMSLRPREKVVTIQLNVHYLSAFRSGELTISADAIHETRNMVTVKGKATTDQGQLASFATGSFRVKIGSPP